MKKLIKILLVLVLLVVVLAVVAVLSLDSIIKAGVEKVGPAVTKTPMTLEGVNVSLLSGSGELKGFVMGNPEGFKTPAALKAGSVAVSVQPSSVLGDKVVVRYVRMVAPEVTLEAGLKGSNLGKILDNVQQAGGSQSKPGEKPADKPAEKPADKGGSSGGGKKLQVDEFVIKDAKLSGSATLLGGQAVSVTLPEIRFTNLGQGPDGITPAELTSKVMAALVEAAGKAVGAGALKVGAGAVDALKGTTGGATETLKKAGSGIGDLFNKKDK